MSTNPVLQNILKGILHTEKEEKSYKNESSGKNKIQKRNG
jgi:hypothetical protein